jgi:hypothetical protein
LGRSFYRKFLPSRPPTDFEILKEIYERHREDFPHYVGRRTKIMVPIDLPAIAKRLDIDAEMVFGRLYFHLDPKYGEEPAYEGDARKTLFTPVAGKDKNCVNFPLLEAVLAGLWQERRRDLWTLGTALFSLVIAIASLLISIFFR